MENTTLIDSPVPSGLFGAKTPPASATDARASARALQESREAVPVC
jgi:hypothetical protein